MCTGRCPCGYTAHTGLVEQHQVECAQFARLYSEGSPVPTPGEEYDRWQTSGKAAEKHAAHAVVVADTDARRAAMADRFATRDILDD